MQPSKKSLKKTIPVAPKKLLDYEVRFAELHARALASGFSSKELCELAALKRLHRVGTYKLLPVQFHAKVTNFLRTASRFRRFIKLLAGLLIFATILQFWRLDLYRQSGWVSLFIDKRKLNSELCVFEMPDKIPSITMPPVDCNRCKSLRKVARRSALSQLDFDEKFAYSGIPLVVTDGASNWTALKTFSLDFFKRVYRNSDATASRDVCQFFPYKTEFRGLHDVFNMTAERSRQPWYIGWSNCNPNVANILRRHYRIPYFLPSQSEGSTIDWIFMGSPGYGAQLHIDLVGKPSWQAQIRGKKLWTLKPVPECYATCHELRLVLQPGEILVIDSNQWYHKTEVIGEEISIAIGSEYD